MRPGLSPELMRERAFNGIFSRQYDPDGPAFERVFVRIAEVLVRAGVGWDDVVDMTTFHTDLPAQIDAFVAVKNRHVKGPPPAWTAIGISRLYEPTAIVEVKVVARKPKG